MPVNAAYSLLRPCPSGHAPTGRGFLQGNRKHRAGLLGWLPLLLVREVRGNDHIGTVSRDIDVPGVAEGDDPIGNPILLGVGIVVIRPSRASPRAVPFVGRKFVDDGCLLRACREGGLYVALVEAVRELVNGHHHIGFLICSSGSCYQYRYGGYDEYLLHVFFLPCFVSCNAYGSTAAHESGDRSQRTSGAEKRPGARLSRGCQGGLAGSAISLVQAFQCGHAAT